ncbi:C10orf2 (predicted) [Pycnogonum litorale]
MNVVRKTLASNLHKVFDRFGKPLTCRHCRFISTILKEPSKYVTRRSVYITRDFCQAEHVVEEHKANFLDFENSQPITATEMKEFLNTYGISFKVGYTCLIVKLCPLCVNSNSADHCSSKQHGRLFINMTTGWFKCDSCRNLGNFYTFKDYIIKTIAGNSVSLINSEERIVDAKLCEKYHQARKISQLSDREFEKFSVKFKIEPLSPIMLDDCGFRYSDDELLLVPLYDAKKNIAVIHKINEHYQDDAHYSVAESNACDDLLFGWQDIKPDDKEVIVTSSPLYMAAIKQALKNSIVCVALPHGSASLSQNLLPTFEQFDKITLWFDTDMRSWESAKIFARKLDETRCYLVCSHTNKYHPLKALSSNRVKEILKMSEAVSHRCITSFRSLRQDVYRELSNSEEVAGVKWKRFPTLNRLLKGHRRAELTVLTGPTGCGKTTFVSEYSLDLCTQGVITLWGSFEIQNVRLAKMMLTQFSRMSMQKNLLKFDYCADRFEALKLYFMTFRGPESLKMVLGAMHHAVYVHDIQHIVIDNLQFMIGTTENSRFDRFHEQDLIVAAFRKFATVNNCHVTLVVHPRKESENEELRMSSIFGGAKVSQEADNILILQNRLVPYRESKKFIQVCKNRFDGEIGVMPIKFDKETLSFGEKANDENSKSPNDVKYERWQL